MFDVKTHISINQQINVLNNIFPLEILNIIEYFVIKNKSTILNKNIYLSASKFKNIRDNLERNYISRQIYNAKIERQNYSRMLNEMIKQGINTNNPEYIPLYRQRAIAKPQVLWWTL